MEREIEMAKNIEKQDTYTMGFPYTVKHTSDDLLQMSCYGWHFTNWTDENGDTLSANNQYTFEVTQKSLSANWEKNLYNVYFWREKNATTQEQYALSSVLYKEKCVIPGTPTPPEKTRFNKWTVIGGAKYTLDDLSSVSCEMELIAEFIKQWYVGFEYKNDGVGVQLCQLTCDADSKLGHEKYPSLEGLQKPCYTVSSFDPYEIEKVTQDTTVFVIDQANTISARYTDPNFKYNKQPHNIVVEDYIKTPYYDGDVVVRYADINTSWRKTPISYTNVGNYTLSISLSSENYFERVYEVLVKIANEDDITFTFKDFFNDHGEKIQQNLLVTPYYRIPESERPTAYDTVSSTFDGWNPAEYLESPTSEHNEVSAVYRLKKFTATYYWDNTIPSLSGTVCIEPIEVEYGGNAYSPSPNYKTIGDEKWKCDGWFREPVGREPTSRTIIGNNILSNLTDNISAYAFMRKVHPIKAYMVYGDNVVLSTLDGDISTIIDYDYLSSDQIGLSTIQNYEFDHWYPTFDIAGSGKDGSWKIDKDNYSISAVYKAKVGTLTYHSHYPEV